MPFVEHVGLFEISFLTTFGVGWKFDSGSSLITITLFLGGVLCKMIINV